MVKPYLLVSLVLVAAPVIGHAAEQLIPAGSLLQCTVAEPKLSSKTTDIGDPVLCQVSHVERYGRSVFPYGSYLVGRFEDYKDPGHFFGKGWMELKFERMVVPPDQVIPIAAKVVYAPKYPVDKEGRIHGTGHTVRDTIEWMIPVLWPIDLLTLPRRGPRPVLKAETRLTLKIMDDFGVPLTQTVASPYYQPRDSNGLQQRAPMSYAPPPAAPLPALAPQPYHPAAYAPAYRQPVPVIPVWRAPAPPAFLLMMRDGNSRLTTDYWVEGDRQLRYISMNGAPVVIPFEFLDLPSTVEINRQRGVIFTMRSAWQ